MLILDALLQGILMGLLFALVALGLTIIFGMMDIVNFAHGEFLMIGMYTTYWTSLLLHIDPLITLPASAIVGMRLLLGPFIIHWTKLSTAILSLFAFLLVYYLLHRTKLGKALRATALNREAANYMGIKTDRMNALAWMIGGGTVGIRGGLWVNFGYF